VFVVCGAAGRGRTRRGGAARRRTRRCAAPTRARGRALARTTTEQVRTTIAHPAQYPTHTTTHLTVFHTH
jgi:hypothetical protein